MKFCDKLQKRRKEKNMSQEQLADNVEFQDKLFLNGESGRSYPDMDKIMLLCDILDCNIYDLIDDVASGKTPTPSKAKKMNIGNYLQEFLSFITKTVKYVLEYEIKGKNQMCIRNYNYDNINYIYSGNILYLYLQWSYTLFIKSTTLSPTKYY